MARKSHFFFKVMIFLSTFFLILSGLAPIFYAFAPEVSVAPATTAVEEAPSNDAVSDSLE